MGIIGIRLVVEVTRGEEFIQGGSGDRGKNATPKGRGLCKGTSTIGEARQEAENQEVVSFKGPDSGQRSREQELKSVLGCDNQAATGE